MEGSIAYRDWTMKMKQANILFEVCLYMRMHGLVANHH